jgi:hypothetical protein
MSRHSRSLQDCFSVTNWEAHEFTRAISDNPDERALAGEARPSKTFASSHKERT